MIIKERVRERKCLCSLVADHEIERLREREREECARHNETKKPLLFKKRDGERLR